MKLVIIGVAALVVGLGAGTGLGIVTRPKAKSVPHASADSTATAAHADSAARPAHAARPARSEPPAVAAPHAAPEPHAGAEPAPQPLLVKPIAVVASSRPAALDFAPVAKILADMKPAEAAVILAHLSDDEVEGLLRSLGARQAAVFMAQMPPERGANLSRRLMRPSVKAQP